MGLQQQLFVDDYAIERMDGVQRILHQAERHRRNPIVKPEHPWEGTALESPIVFRDDELKLFRMYYWAINRDAIYTCYATSPDGISWRKPVLGLHKGPDGSKQNNIVLRGQGTSARTRYVIRNPYSDDPARKFLAMYIDNTPGLTEYIAYSPDGLNWTTATRIGDAGRPGLGDRVLRGRQVPSVVAAVTVALPAQRVQRTVWATQDEAVWIDTHTVVLDPLATQETPHELMKTF